MGRIATKKVEVNNAVVLNQRFIYRGYLQIACCDLPRDAHPCLWLITWDPTQRTATRPLAIQKDGTWYAYGWDLSKNVCEVFGQAGYIRTTYTYSPYGAVTASGDVSQPFRWSSEFDDEELGLVYYNYRHYNPTDGRWISRDPIDEQNGGNFLEENEKHLLYIFINNSPFCGTDIIGLTAEWENGDVKDIVRQSYSIDFPAVELTQAADNLILLPIFNSKAIISAAYSAILMPSAAIRWNGHVVFMHRHFLAGSGTDYTYMPDKIKGLEYSVREG